MTVALALIALAAGPAPAQDVCTGACQRRVIVREKRETIRPYRAWLRSTRACESGGDYNAVSSGGTYTGAYQFDDQSFRAAGGKQRRAMHAGRLEQDYRAVRWLKMAGRGAWPRCG